MTHWFLNIITHLHQIIPLGFFISKVTKCSKDNFILSMIAHKHPPHPHPPHTHRAPTRFSKMPQFHTFESSFTTVCKAKWKVSVKLPPPLPVLRESFSTPHPHLSLLKSTSSLYCSCSGSPGWITCPHVQFWHKFNAGCPSDTTLPTFQDGTGTESALACATLRWSG